MPIQQLDPKTWHSDGRNIPNCSDGLLYLVDGQIQEWTGDSQEVHSCAFFMDGGKPNRPLLGRAPLLDEKEALRALDAADRAWANGRGEWPTMRAEDRIKCVQQFLDLMKEKREVVVERMMWEIGKTQADSYKEFDRTVKYVTQTIAALKDLERRSTQFHIDEGFMAQCHRSPLGVTLVVPPYNYALNELQVLLVPALIMGNPCVVKLPRYGQLLNTPLLECYAKAFPRGVVNIVQGPGRSILPPIMKDGRVAMLAFIGGSKSAGVLKSYHPLPHRFKSVLSLDAKNLGVVFQDADMDMVIPQLIAGCLGFNGQRCTAIKMIYVHESKKDELIERLVKEVNKLKAGHPWTEGVKLTPVADVSSVSNLKDMIQDAINKGARVMNEGGGECVENYLHPAILFPVGKDAKLSHLEQFGPVIPIQSFKDTEEVIDYVTESEFGQQVALFGYDSHVIGPLIDVLVNQVSRINLNAQASRGPDTLPFGGRGNSANSGGTLSITAALTRFSMDTLVATPINDQNRALVNQILTNRTSNYLNTDLLY